MKKFSIKHIAQLSGVSPATVSRVINNSGIVNEDKKNRVLEVIQETNYVPNKIAKSLFSNSSKMLGYIVPNITNPFFNELGRYMEQFAFEKGYHVILCNSNNDLEKENEYMRNLISMNCDGIMIITNNSNSDSKITIPTVFVDREHSKQKNCITVTADHRQGGRISAEFLYNKGCRKIAYLARVKKHSAGMQRYEAYSNFCKENNLEEMVVDCSYSFEDGLLKADMLLDTYPDIDGIICGNDLVAMACYKVMHKRKICDKIKIIGYDNILGSARYTPGITTVAQPLEELARTVIDEMIIQIENKTMDAKKIVLPVSIVERETT